MGKVESNPKGETFELDSHADTTCLGGGALKNLITDVLSMCTVMTPAWACGNIKQFLALLPTRTHIRGKNIT